MTEIKSTKKEVKAGKNEHPPGRWMALGIGIGATLWILFGSFILGPAMGSHTIGLVTGMSMGAGAGLVMGLSLGSRGNQKSVNKKQEKS